MKEAHTIPAQVPDGTLRDGNKGHPDAPDGPGLLAHLSATAQVNLLPATKALFYATLFAFALYVALGASSEVAYAQSSGGAIEQSIQNAQDWLASIMTTLGGLGLIASIGVKAVARTNENMHHAAHLGMTGSCIAILTGALLPDILDLVQSFAA